MDHATLPSVANASLPAAYEAAKFALAECSRLDECKDWSDKAQAMASYAKQSKDKEMEKTAMRIRSRATRRCGELYKEIEKGKTGPKQLKGDTPPQLTRKDAAAQAGLSPDQAKQALRVANIPEEDFNEQVDSEDPPTITKLAEQGVVKRDTPKAPPIPHYDQRGMTKKEFQAGMHFRGALDSLVRELKNFDPQTVADGSTPEERIVIREQIGKIDHFFDQLIAKL